MRITVSIILESAVKYEAGRAPQVSSKCLDSTTTREPKNIDGIALSMSASKSRPLKGRSNEKVTEW